MRINHYFNLSEDMALKLIELQQQAYQVEAALINYPKLPPLAETTKDLLVDSLKWYVATNDHDVMGAVAIDIKPSYWELNKVIVSPNFFRKGIGRRLIQEVKERAQAPIFVTTASHNLPAVNLYKSEGFQPFKNERTTEGLVLETFIYKKS
ncbi:hypothetical protein AB685_23100 [Bacillus sp. LL01]|uniref:GNAT family N-acetyltransferase n=1 Tax=Bacillus sp. LL01 TaxID=1665556 RepID=UPI00064D0334|nr:GNAT family N-acetyltransferase [Bacillus sp. LL01]KMJ56229.1 hypothetical protein AB685_23100 [Bacillus sp. LL01]